MKEFDPIQAVGRSGDLVVRYNKLPQRMQKAFAFKAMREVQGFETTTRALIVPTGQDNLKDSLLRVFVETAAFFILVTRDSDAKAQALATTRIVSATQKLRGDLS